MCMYDTSDSAASCYNETLRTARKEHRCGECRRIIKAGEQYLYCSGVWDGRGSSYKACSHCAVAMTWLSKECGGYLFTQVEEDIYEHAREYKRMDLARLYVGMKRGWDRFRGGLMPMPKLPALTS